MTTRKDLSDMNDWTTLYYESDGTRLCCRVAEPDVGARETQAACDTSTARSEQIAPVLLLHSLFFDGTMFDAVRAVWPSTLTLYAPDHRGQGASPLGDTAPSMAQLARDMIRLIERHIGEPVNIIGSSMGGYIALEMARQRPDVVRSYVLSCCTAFAERQPARFAALEARIRAEGTESLGQPLLDTMFGERFVAENDERCRHWRTRFELRGASVADAVHGVFGRAGYESVLPTITQPVLVCSGGLDRAKRPDDMQVIADAIPGTAHVIFEDSGHTPPVECPTRFAEATIAFLRRNGLRANGPIGGNAYTENQARQTHRDTASGLRPPHEERSAM